MSDITPQDPTPSATPASTGAGTDNTMGTLALIAGITAITCLPLVGGILGIVFGRIGIRKAEQGLASNGGAAKAGFWLGIVGLALAVIGFILWIAIFALAAKNGTMDITACGFGDNPPCE